VLGHIDCTTWVLRNGRLSRRFAPVNTLKNLVKTVLRRKTSYLRYEAARIRGMFFMSSRFSP
jgi:hypothetical protein